MIDIANHRGCQRSGVSEIWEDIVLHGSTPTASPQRLLKSWEVRDVSCGVKVLLVVEVKSL